MGAIELARELLQIPSPSGEEREIGEYLEQRLKKNFSVARQYVDERFNLIATTGEPFLVLTTHMDTITNQIPYREDDNFLYGRGACDTKGTIASMVIAAEKSLQDGLSGFALLFDVSEEDDFSGIKEAVNLVKPPYVVLGEPTDFYPVVGQKGLLGYRIRFMGKAAPGSLPEKGVSAITPLVEALYKINYLGLPTNEVGRTSLNIGLISGGTGINVVPADAEAKLEFRTTVPNKDIKELVEGILSPDCYTILTDYEMVKPQRLWFASEKEPQVAPYFSELYFWAEKSNAIVFGAGDYTLAHSDEERIAKKDIEVAVKCYMQIIRQTLNLRGG